MDMRHFADGLVVQEGLWEWLRGCPGSTLLASKQRTFADQEVLLYKGRFLSPMHVVYMMLIAIPPVVPMLRFSRRA